MSMQTYVSFSTDIRLYDDPGPTWRLVVHKAGREVTLQVPEEVGRELVQMHVAVRTPEGVYKSKVLSCEVLQLQGNTAATRLVPDRVRMRVQISEPNVLRGVEHTFALPQSELRSYLRACAAAPTPAAETADAAAKDLIGRSVLIRVQHIEHAGRVFVQTTLLPEDALSVAHGPYR